MVGTRNSDDACTLLRFHRPHSRAIEAWMACRLHPRTRRQWFHDRLGHQYRHQPTSRVDRCYWIQASHPSSVTNPCPYLHSSRDPVYKVIINTLKFLPRTRLDAAWGIAGLVGLYAIRMTCARLQRRFPRLSKGSISELHPRELTLLLP